MKIVLKFTVFGMLTATSLSAANAGLFTNCKSKCAEERCAGDSGRKAECKKKCPKVKACQDVGNDPKREAQLQAKREAKQKEKELKQEEKNKAALKSLGITEESFAKQGQETSEKERERKRKQQEAILKALTRGGLD